MPEHKQISLDTVLANLEAEEKRILRTRWVKADLSVSKKMAKKATIEKNHQVMRMLSLMKVRVRKFEK